MKMIQHAGIGLVLFTITTSGLALADCPNTMPEKLLIDCISYENSESGFPTDDYAYMDEYQEWLKTHQPKVIIVKKSQSIQKSQANIASTLD